MHTHTHIHGLKSNRHIAVIPTVFVFYCCATNYCKVSVKYEFVFSQFPCIRGWNLAGLGPLLRIPVAATHVSPGCFPLWTWTCLANSCKDFVGKNQSRLVVGTSSPLSCWFSAEDGAVPRGPVAFPHTWQPSFQAQQEKFSLWSVQTESCTVSQIHHLCHTIEPNQASTCSATFVIMSCLQASCNSTYTRAGRR